MNFNRAVFRAILRYVFGCVALMFFFSTLSFLFFGSPLIMPTVSGGRLAISFMIHLMSTMFVLMYAHQEAFSRS